MRTITWNALMLFGLLGTMEVSASTTKETATPPALMVSDTHFNPFHDPAKVKKLEATPASGWEAIFASADSPTQARDFEALSKACTLRGIDTPYSLFASAIRAIHRDAAGARFITISGDLMAHRFDCMFEKTLPGATPEQYTVFTAKTIEYEVLQLRQALPGATFYLALGNNDSSCGDYRLDPGMEWFKILARVAADGVGRTWTRAATQSFESGGYYSVEMAPPMRKTRLIVVDDTFLAGGYKTCKAELDAAPGEKQMAWLQQQLDDARVHHERVWVMGHIPPGVSARATFQQEGKKSMNLCTAKGKPAKFMPTDLLDDTMIKNADVIKLGIFGHTHVDEFRLLSADAGAIPIKNVPSITTIGGNDSSFTIAKVDPRTAELADFTVMRSPDPEGSNWEKEYTFSAVYGGPFTPTTLRKAIARMADDPGEATTLSQDFILYWSVGVKRELLQPMWAGYVCGMDHSHAADYKECVCRGPLGKGLDPGQ